MAKLIVIKSGSGSGSFGGFIPGSPVTVCDAACTGAWAELTPGVIVTLIAQAAEGSRFIRWKGYTVPAAYTFGLVPGQPPPLVDPDLSTLFSLIQTSTATPLVGTMPGFDLLILAQFDLLGTLLAPIENAELSATDPCPSVPLGIYNFAETIVVPYPEALIADVGGHVMRLGHDCPCGSPSLLHRVAYRFDIQGIGPNQKQVFFRFYRLINVSPSNPQKGGNMQHPGVGSIVLEWVQHDSALGIGTTDTTVYFAPAIYSAGVVLTPSSPEGFIYADVTAAVNAAKAQGYRNLVLRMRLVDETPVDCQDGASWYAVSGVQSATPYEPALDFTKPDPIVIDLKGQVPGTVTFSVIEPCVILVGDKLATLPDLADWGRREIQNVRRGNILEVRVALLDHLTAPGHPVNVSQCRITLTAADGTVVITLGVMERVDVGVYRYLYQTQVTDPLGLYMGEFEVTP